jgi:DNA-binding ferritin-like protein (Dps family)
MPSFIDWIKRLRAEKRDYRAMMARAKALPEEYWFVFDKVQHYMWNRAAGSGRDMLALQYDLIEMFEAGAAEDKPVLEVTGDDVAAFADELIRNARTYTEDWHQKLNREIHDKLNKEGESR